ncbi:MAG: TIGR02996 domain-containing protein [Deltaproteobacteria bacterium]|nr:TIGR02996 domain-containing protein [Deltaproteobacteria bacterium]
MDRVVAARKLIGELVKAEQIEVRRIEIVGRDLAKLCETLKRPPSGQELGEWLEEHAQVSELSASTSLLDELVDRHLADPEAAVTEARNPELERQIREAPDNVGPYSVYADWLQEHGDPLGELIALGIASASGNDDEVARFDRHLKRHEAYFLGGLGPQLATRIGVRWRYGLVQGIDAIGEPVAPAVWEQLLRLRVCELVESITLRRTCSTAIDAAIAAAAPESLRALALEDCVGTLPPALMQRSLRSLSIQHPYGLALDQQTLSPSLERLELRVPSLSSVIPLELGVRDLEVVVTEATVEFLSKTRLPRVERLTLDLDDTPVSTVLAFLEPLRLPALTHLAVRNGQLDAKTFVALAKLPLAATLHSLGLVNLGLTDETIAPIAGTRGFSALEEVDVSHNELSREGVETARGLAHTVVSTRQLRRGQSMEKRVRKFAGNRLYAAEEIADPKAWRRAGIDGDLRWARYRGEAEYELFISADLSRYGCSCPSSIQPCKHVVALALVAERTPLSPAPANGIEARVTTRGGLTGLMLATLDE